MKAGFYKQITKLSDKFKYRDLEEYLLALFKLIEINRTKELTYELILEIISEAFTSELYGFKNEWLKCKTAPDENRMSRKFTNPDINETIDKTNKSDLTPYDFTIEVLKFQIAELHKMRGNQLENEYRFFGIRSETGNSWYNFDPFVKLECGARCLEDNETDFKSLDWLFIGELLENGRMIDKKYDTKLSKFLSLVLRHKPEEIGIELDSNGWTDVNGLIEKMNAYGKHIDFETINKKRFSFNEDKSLIRANQGHSIEIDLGFISKHL